MTPEGFVPAENLPRWDTPASQMTPEKAALLRVKFEPKEIGQLPRKNRDGSVVWLDYVGHAAVTDRLLKADPGWTWEPLSFTEDGRPLIVTRGNTVTMWIRLTVCGVTRLGVGTVKAEAFDVEKQLIGDAIRNAAMRFGVALDHWTKEELSGFDTGAGSDSTSEAKGPPAVQPSGQAAVNADDLNGDGSPAPVPTRRPQPSRPDPTVPERRR